MSKKKKIIVLSAMILLLAVTAVFNYLLTGTSKDTPVVSAANYFTQYRTERASLRNDQLLQLNAVIDDAEAESGAKETAIAMKVKLTDLMEKEFKYENLLKAMGLTDVVVSIGLDTDMISVMVGDSDFDQDDAIAVYTIMKEEANVTPKNFRIVPIS